MDKDTSIALFKQRLNTNPVDVEAAVNLGNLYFDQNNPPSAIMYYQVALGVRPDQPSVLTDLGTMYWRNLDLALAEQAFRKAIEIDPMFGNAYVNLGYLLHHGRADTPRACEAWQALLDKNPTHPAVEHARKMLAELKTLN